MRALQKEPKDRHASVAELRSDVLAFLRQRDSEHVFREAARTLARLRARGENRVPRALDAQRKAGRPRRALREFLPFGVRQHDARAGSATVDADQIEVLIHRYAR